MKIRIHALGLIFAFVFSHPFAVRAEDGLPPEPPRVEVVFLLDTTGSMSGLIAGAKEKIWSIANEIASANEKPEVRFGLLGYRDRGDDYVTRIHDLSDDMDSVYGDLMKFQAAGGGDGPESVNQALWEGLNRFSWSDDFEVLKLVFLVGDAPPHMDYSDDIHYPRSCEEATARGIIINTVQCGTMGGTQEIWENIADSAGGRYVAIEQSGGMQAVTTPVDGRIAELNREMASTVIVYGDEQAQRRGQSKVDNFVASSAEVAAERNRFLNTSSLSESEIPVAISGREDLVADVATGKQRIEDLDEAQLPAPYRDLSPAEMKAEVAKKAEKRKVIQTEIDELLAERRQFLENLKKESEGGEESDGFDEKVREMIREQGADKGVTWH